MSAESAVAGILRADPDLSLILTGGIYAQGEMSPEGITRETCPDAFDENSGFLLPIALIKQRGLVPDGNVVDHEAQATSTIQIVEVWLYQNISYEAIDAAMARIYRLLQGHIFDGTFETVLANTIDRQRDNGALMDASMARMDFAIYGVIEPTV